MGVVLEAVIDAIEAEAIEAEAIEVTEVIPMMMMILK
jgi:hypothetical protein